MASPTAIHAFQGKPAMAFSLYDASVPVFVQMLNSLTGILNKTSEHAAAKKLDPAVLLATRLYPDMFPLSRQIQFCSDFSKGPCARLAGLEPPKYADEEKTFDELKARIAKTVDFIKSLDAKAIEAAADKPVKFMMRGEERTMKGSVYLLHYQMPQLFFHHTVSYSILRHLAIDVGKRDFLGAIPGLS
jgi:hypothetical protein